MIAHHTTYLTPNNINDPEISLNHVRLEALCQDCHNKEHMRTNEATADGLMFDSSGQLIRKAQRGYTPL